MIAYHLPVQAPDPEAGRIVAEDLRHYGARRELVRAAELGYVTELACAIPDCLCPEELGATRFFERKTRPLPDWMPTPDHFPKLKMEGGRLAPDNNRLAHRLCNRVDFSKLIGRPYAKDLARVEAARRRAIEAISRSGD